MPRDPVDLYKPSDYVMAV